MGTENENLPLEEYKSIVEFSQRQIERVRSYYIWAASIIGGIFIVGALLIYGNISDIKGEIRELKQEAIRDIESFKDGSKSDVDILSQKLKADLEVETNTIKNEIISRINKEFDKENIQLLVEQKAKERIDKIADKIIENKISERITPRINEALSKITSIETEIYDIVNIVAEVAEMTIKSSTWDSALTDDQKIKLIKKIEHLKSKAKGKNK